MSYALTVAVCIKFRMGPKNLRRFALSVLSTISMTNSFPKIIWQTHNYKKEWLPKHLNQICATWKNLNPGWDYRYVDHIERDEFVSQYPEIYEIYKYQPPAHQSDIWRYLVTYEFGGCYADMDSVCVKPLDSLLNIDADIVLVPKTNGQGNNHNYLVKEKSQAMSKVVKEMMAEPKNLIGWATWDVFTDNVYYDSKASELFIMLTVGNDEQAVACHSDTYKDKFNLSTHRVNSEGKIIDYLNFLKEKNLSEFL
jgi:hypothetical protein